MNAITIPIPQDRQRVTEFWTQEERRALIAVLADELAEHAQGLRLVDARTVLDACERVRFLAIASTAFLNSNKDQILNGPPR